MAKTPITTRPVRLLRLIVPAAALIVSTIAIGAVRQWFHASPHLDNPDRTARLRARTPPGMVLVPDGDFIAGTDDADADDDVRPKRRERVAAFYIDLHEVTNREFQKFDPAHSVPPGEENLPASSITYARAAAFARWAGKRLPTELEWEKAARGTDGRRFPWGDVWDSHRVAPRRKRPGDPILMPDRPAQGKVCAIGPSRLQPVGSIPGGASPYGCMDMAGNAWEWVEDIYNGNPKQRILRGGAVGYRERACRTYHRAIEGDADT